VIGQTLGRSTRIITELGIGLLWISALVTLYTGWDYFRAGIRHLIDE
jgi:cardiolipin synthase